MIRKSIFLACIAAAFIVSLVAGNALGKQPGGFTPNGDHWMPWADNNPYTPLMSRCGVDKVLYEQWHGSLVQIANILAETPGATAPGWWSYFQTRFISCKDMLHGGLVYWSFDRDNLEFKLRMTELL